MKKLLKTFVVFLLVALFALASVGCETKRRPKGGGDSPIVIDSETKALIDGMTFYAANDNSAKDVTAEISVKVTSDQSEKDTINTIIKAFNRYYPNIKVNVDSGDEIKTHYENLMKKFANDKLADVFWVSQDKLDTVCGLEKKFGEEQYYLPTMLMPLGAIDEADPYFDAKNVESAGSDGSVNYVGMIDEAYEVSTYRNELFMLPRDYNQVVMYYNKDMFDAAGVRYPGAEAMTQAQFLDMLADLRAGFRANTTDLIPDETYTYAEYFSSDKPLIDMNVSWDSLCWPIMKSFGGEVANADNTIALDSEANFNAMKFINSLYNDYYYYRSSPDPAATFTLQQKPILFHSRAVMTKILDKTSTEYDAIQRLGVAPMPYFGDTYTVGGGSSGYALNRNSKNLTAAWMFLKFIVSYEGQEAFCSTGNGVPVRKDLINDDGAAWRNVDLPALGDDFNHDAFLYGMNWTENKPFTSTRDFFKYVGVGAQTGIVEEFSKLFDIISKDPTDDQIRTQLSASHAAMAKLASENKKASN